MKLFEEVLHRIFDSALSLTPELRHTSGSQKASTPTLDGSVFPGSAAVDVSAIASEGKHFHLYNSPAVHDKTGV